MGNCLPCHRLELTYTAHKSFRLNVHTKFHIELFNYISGAGQREIPSKEGACTTGTCLRRGRFVDSQTPASIVAGADSRLRRVFFVLFVFLLLQ